MKIIILFFFFIFSLFFVKAQNKIFVNAKDTTKMKVINGEILFNDDLSDGHYVFNNSLDSNIINKELIVSDNMNKRIYYDYVYDKPNVIEKMFSFRNNLLNGPFIINWIDGEKNYNGYFKNGFPDSIWTYYDYHYKQSNSDSSFCWKKKEILNEDGKQILLNYWNEHGERLVTNGTGKIITNVNDLERTTIYINGLKNGVEKEIILDTNTNWFNYYPSERNFINEILTNETLYYDKNHIKSISEWIYPFSPKIDTINEFFDVFKCKRINILFSPVRNGYWVSYYKNGNKLLEGNYQNGKRVGNWYWYHENGIIKVAVDYITNKYFHYNENGQLISNKQNEYLTYLCDKYWTINKINDSTIVYTQDNYDLSETSFMFRSEGKIVFENESFFSESTFKLNVDTLEISYNDNNVNGIYTYKIMYANEDNIELMLLQKK